MRGPTFRKLSLQVIRILAMLVVGLAVYLTLFENRLIFYPEPTLAGSPHIPFEDIRFSAGDGTRLHGWFIPFKDSKRIFIISHGNAGNIGDRYEMGEFINREFQANTLMYDYRGYGQSEGRPSESGVYSDLSGAVRYVLSRGFSPNDVYLIGQSLGSAVTVEIAGQQPVAGLILEAPFTSIRALARRIAFSLPVDYFLRARFDSLSKIRNVRSRIAVVHGTRDPVIPFALGQQLFDAAPAPKRFFQVDAEIHEGALMALGVERTKELREFLFNIK